MSRKKKHEHVNHERLLVSYADFITLLFAFFVVLFASSQSDKKKQERMAAAMQNAFAQTGIFDAHSKTPALMPSGESGSKPLSVAVAAAKQEEQMKQRICDGFDALDRKQHAAKRDANGIRQKPAPPPFSFRSTQEGMVISLQDAGFFDSGSAVVRANSMELLQRIADSLPAGAIRVEGHTDNAPMRSEQFRSNWELSTARATAVARILLESRAVTPEHLAIAGYGEFHPVADNSTEEGRARNRRVDIVVLRDTSAPTMATALVPQTTLR